MPGDVLGADLETIYYIRSESAFGIAQTRGRLEVVKGWITRCDPYLRSIGDVIGSPHETDTIYLGQQEIPVRKIAGSVGREKEFSQHFYPLSRSPRQRERWRLTYALSLAGKRFPPIDVCKVGGTYYVLNGHHRVSVARYLNWSTVHAHVSELVLRGAAP